MREIKFRAQDIASNKWLYGDVRHHKNDVCIFEQGGTKGELVKCETIGQYTGLKDKNGEEIYEGDIVEVYDFTSVYASKYRGVVELYCGSWCVVYKDNTLDLVAHPRLIFDDFADRKTQVIGNIHDNPELLNKRIMEKAKIWIARDKDGSLYLYNEEPMKAYDWYFANWSTDALEIDRNSHPEITWENSPQLIEV